MVWNRDHYKESLLEKLCRKPLTPTLHVFPPLSSRSGVCLTPGLMSMHNELAHCTGGGALSCNCSQSPLWPVASGGRMCASREGRSPVAILAFTGPGMPDSRVGYVNKEVKDSWTLSHLGITLLHYCSPCGLFVPWVFVHAPPHTPQLTSLGIYTMKLAPGELAARWGGGGGGWGSGALPGLQLSLMHVSY